LNNDNLDEWLNTTTLIAKNLESYVSSAWVWHVESVLIMPNVGPLWGLPTLLILPLDIISLPFQDFPTLSSLFLSSVFSVNFLNLTLIIYATK